MSRPGYQIGPRAGLPPTWLPPAVRRAVPLRHGTLAGGTATGASSRSYGFPTGRRGIAPEADVLAANVTVIAHDRRDRPMPAVTAENLADALELIDEGDPGFPPRPDVINISLGNPSVNYSGRDCDDEAARHPRESIRAIAEAIGRIESKRIVVVAAVGNGLDRVGYPACLSRVIAVGGLGADGTPLRRYVPPEGRIDVVARAERIEGPAPGWGVQTDSGTSYAAPQVAGAIALYLEKNPSHTPRQIRSRIGRVLPAVGHGTRRLPLLRVPELLGIPRSPGARDRSPDCLTLHLRAPDAAPSMRRGLARVVCTPTTRPIDRIAVTVTGPGLSDDAERRGLPLRSPAFYGANPTLIGPPPFIPEAGATYRVCYLLYTRAEPAWPHMIGCREFET